MDRHRGHKIYVVESNWLYRDTNQLVADQPERDCGFCNLPQTPEGHDACLGTLPDVMNACCGHGQIDDAYVQLLDGSCIRGELTMSYNKRGEA